jgi:hypothetical protein
VLIFRLLSFELLTGNRVIQIYIKIVNLTGKTKPNLSIFVI